MREARMCEAECVQPEHVRLERVALERVKLGARATLHHIEHHVRAGR